MDGYFASNNEMTGGVDWFIQDPAVDKSDTLIVGRITFNVREFVASTLE